MKKSVWFPGLLVLFVLAAAMKTPHENKMDIFKWLIGTWSTTTNEGRLLETWRPMNDSTYEGESTLFKKTTETVQLEKMELGCRGKEYYFSSEVAGQNEGKKIRFRLTKMDKKSFTAENPDHDFPKRISYLLVKKDSLRARIDDGLDKPQSKSDFFFARVKGK